MIGGATSMSKVTTVWADRVEFSGLLGIMRAGFRYYIDIELKKGTSQNKMAKGQFDLEDMRDQLLQMEQMGGMEALMDKMP
jgi:hypothetical protein